MDIATLALTAYALAKPFLEKTGEGVARKIGEDIWGVIKKPFAQKELPDPEGFALTDQNSFTLSLESELTNNPDLASELTAMVQKAQIQLGGNLQQNINNYDKVEKQINIQQNTGNITM